MKQELLYVPLLGAGAMLAAISSPQLEARSEYSREEVDAAKESIALSVMGQTQMAFGDLMWLKSLEYLHNGVAYRMPTNQEKVAGFVESDSQGTPVGLSHTEGVAMVLEPLRDWRGFVGNLHREIVPFQKHSHSDPVELIPWYQLCIKLNPHLERLYTMGAFFMADFANEPEEGRELLEAGAKANPDSFEIHGALGRILHDYFKDYDGAIESLDLAVTLGECERDRLRAKHERMDDTQQQIYSESYLFLAKSLTEKGQYDKALEVLDRGYKFTAYNNLRVQKRITERKKSGLGSEELESQLAQ